MQDSPATPPPEHTSHLRPAAASAPARPLTSYDWELEADLQEAQQLSRRFRRSKPATIANSTTGSPSPASVSKGTAPPSAATASPKRSDATPASLRRGVIPPPHARFAAPPVPPFASPSPAAARPRSRSPRSGSPGAWLLLALGLMLFVCGAVLLGWSVCTGRRDLWNLGLPLLLVGQAGLVLGIVLQLDGLSQASRETSAALTDLDERLADIRHTTTLLGSASSSAAQSFYLHLAEGAQPDLLLTDLKGQLDLLALRLANQKR